MSNTIASVTAAPPVTQAPAASQVSKQAKPVPNARPQSDPVQISNAARQLLQEASEAPSQTAKEAQGGDRQAQRLLAKETAASHAIKQYALTSKAK